MDPKDQTDFKATEKKKRGSSVYLGGDNIYPDNSSFSVRHSEVKLGNGAFGDNASCCQGGPTTSNEGKLHLLVIGIENMKSSKDQARVEEIIRSAAGIKVVFAALSTRAVRVEYFASPEVSSCSLRDALAAENFEACVLLDNLIEPTSPPDAVARNSESPSKQRMSTQKGGGCGSRHTIKKRLTLGISNMNDTSDQKLVENALLGLPGVTSVKAALSNASVVIDYHGTADGLSEDILVSAVEPAGFDVEVILESNLVSKCSNCTCVNCKCCFEEVKKTPRNSRNLTKSAKRLSLLNISGLSGQSSVENVRKSLLSVPGVTNVTVAASSGIARVEYTSNAGESITPMMISSIEAKGLSGHLLKDSLLMEDSTTPKSTVVLASTITPFSAAPDSSTVVDKEKVTNEPRNKLVLIIEGMTCSSCSGTVERALQAHLGVESAVVSLSTNTATIEYVPSKTNAQSIVSAVEDVGFGAEIIDDNGTTNLATNRLLVLVLEGMTCAVCSGTIERALKSVAGVVSASVNLTTNSANIEYVPSNTLNASVLVGVVEDVGFGAEIQEESTMRPHKRQGNNKMMRFSVGVSGAVNEVKEGGQDENEPEEPSQVLLTCVMPVDALITKDELLSMIANLPGVVSAEYTKYCKGKKVQMKVVFWEDQVGPRLMYKRAKRLGIELSASSYGGFLMAGRLQEQQKEEVRRQRNRFLIAIILTIPIVLVSMILTQIPDSNEKLVKPLEGSPGVDALGVTLVVLTTIVEFGVGFKFHKKALSSIRSRSLGMDFLVSTGTGAAWLFSMIGFIQGAVDGYPRDEDTMYFETAAVLITAVILGKYLEIFARGKTAGAIHKLMNLRAKTARLIADPFADASPPAVGEAVLSPGMGNVVGSSGKGKTDSSTFKSNKSFQYDTVSLEMVDVSDSTSQTTKSSAGVNKGDHTSELPDQERDLESGGDVGEGNDDTKLSKGPGDDEIIDASLLQRGDIVRLIAGEIVPADGVLLDEQVGIDESMMTGESRIVPKKVGDPLFGGTAVVDGSALMRVTACGDKSALGKIVSMVQEAQASKPPIQELADKVAAHFVPFVMVSSFITFIAWLGAIYKGQSAGDTMNEPASPVGQAFFFALAVWVSACPCAFGLATPTAIMVGTGVAAKHGVLVRRGASLQFAAEVSAVAFDKTGTLTQGNTVVVDFFILSLDGKHVIKNIIPSSLAPPPPILADDSSSVSQKVSTQVSASGDNDESIESLTDQKELLSLLHAGESRSSHPIAVGIAAFCVSRISELEKAIAAKSNGSAAVTTSQAMTKSYVLEMVPGMGFRMECTQEGGPDSNVAPITTNMLVGSSTLLEQEGVTLHPQSLTLAEDMRKLGKIAIFVAVDNILRGVVGLSDTIRPEAPFVIANLQKQGIECYMITGDNVTTATAISKLLGIPPSHTFAGMSPEGKEAKIRELKEERNNTKKDASTEGAVAMGGKVPDHKEGKVAFIGDGTNDSIALASADVGIAMASGTDIAVGSGDLVLCTNNLCALLTAIDLSRTTMRRIYLNYFWALIYNFILMPISAGVLVPANFKLSPMASGGAMTLSSLSIVISSLLLVLYKPPHKNDE